MSWIPVIISRTHWLPIVRIARWLRLHHHFTEKIVFSFPIESKGSRRPSDISRASFRLDPSLSCICTILPLASGYQYTDDSLIGYFPPEGGGIRCYEIYSHLYKAYRDAEQRAFLCPDIMKVSFLLISIIALITPCYAAPEVKINGTTLVGRDVTILKQDFFGGKGSCG